jgi:hypothetical protein
LFWFVGRVVAIYSSIMQSMREWVKNYHSQLFPRGVRKGPNLIT